jgi:bifunctional non-homologous end joining protein LigD
MDLETDFSSARSKTKPNRNRRRNTAKFPKHLGDCPGAKKSKLPSFLQPQLATLVDAVPQGNGWLHEVKLDGYRALCRIDNGRVTFLTREAQDWTERFSALAHAAQRLPVRQALVDGEVVALGEDGKSSFQLLQNSLRRGPAANLVYFAFDLLHLDGWDLTRSPLSSAKTCSKNSSDVKAPAKLRRPCATAITGSVEARSFIARAAAWASRESSQNELTNRIGREGGAIG